MKEDLESILERYRFELYGEVTRHLIINDLSNFMESCRGRHNEDIDEFIVIDKTTDIMAPFYFLEFQINYTKWGSRFNIHTINLGLKNNKSQWIEYNVSKHKL